PGEEGVNPGLEGAQAGERHEQRQRTGNEEDLWDDGLDVADDPDAQNDAQRKDGPAEDRSEAADSERHGEPPSLLDIRPSPAQPELGVEGAEEDVGHIERTERTFLENRRELLAVAGPPPGGIAPDQERPHGDGLPSWRRPIWANSDRPRSSSARLDAPTAVRRYGRRRSTGG